MAEDLDDGEFWLPSQFLTDDDILMEKKSFKNTLLGCTEPETKACFTGDYPYGVGSFGSSSALSSPVESVVGSTETESDEDDFIAGLTRQMAHSMLLDNEKSAAPAFGTENSKAWAMAVSPQSTLCAVGGWSGYSGGSSRGSPNGPSQVSSPPSTPMDRKDDAWDLLSAAAGQVVRMKINDEGSNIHYGRGVLGPPRKPIPVAAPVKNSDVSFYSNQVLTQQQLQINQFQLLKQQQLIKQQFSAVWAKQNKATGTQTPRQQPSVQNRARTGGYSNGRCGRPVGSSSSGWQQPLPQHQNGGSGMRAVFLDGSTSRRESCGTGVFLPRRIGNSTESRKKPTCSTVLLPARVVQALNLNFDDMGGQPRFNGGFAPVQDAQMARNSAMLSQQKRHFRPQPAMSHEVRLPPEWTY